MQERNSVFVEKVKVRKILYVGDLIDVELPQQHIIGNSRVIDLDFKKKIAKILPPVYKNQKIKLHEHENINIRVYNKGSNVMIKSYVLDISKDNILIYLPTSCYKIQKRLFFRIPIIREGNLFEKDENRIIPFETRDLSAGGLQIAVKEELNTEKEFLLKNLTLDEDFILSEISVKVVRYIGENLFGEKLYGLKFLNLGYDLEKNIVRYVNLYTIKAKHSNLED
jgi:c-di-GMP-binding flagellar brake protein YcgR